MTKEQREELRILENAQKWRFYGNLMKGGVGIAYILTWFYSTLLGFFATIAIGAIFCGDTTNTSRNTDAMNRYYELRSLQIMDDE